eukprot:7190504-Pyramimonas_sp.AAC.1
MSLAEVQARVEDICRRHPVGSDLLFCAFYSAINSHRKASGARNQEWLRVRSAVCTPFPSELFWQHDSYLGADARAKDFEEARARMDDMPSVRDIVNGALAHVSEGYVY